MISGWNDILYVHSKDETVYIESAALVGVVSSWSCRSLRVCQVRSGDSITFRDVINYVAPKVGWVGLPRRDRAGVQVPRIMRYDAGR